MCKSLALMSLALSFLHAVLAAWRTAPPTGAWVVRANTTNAREYPTVSAAVAALPNDTSWRSIFIYPGTYNEHVHIRRKGPITIYGYTVHTETYLYNQVTIQATASKNTAGSEDASGTIRIHQDSFQMYNVNVRNNFGLRNGAGGQNQAISFGEYGNKVGLYACGFFGYQDTLYAQKGTQVYLKNYIEGAIDFIFGTTGSAYFRGNTLAVNGPGAITASGRRLNNSGSYLFESNTIVLAQGAAPGTAGKIFLGRPWGAFAKVIFKHTVANVALNKGIWSVWEAGQPHISNVFLAEYNSTGVGFKGAVRPRFATVLTAVQAKAYSISSTVGSDYARWVDTSYLV